ncbi:MAG: hypothetical protein WC822_01865 [Candidatus Paceibacterota bacterium]|jgi:hypothetical protein
MNKNFLYIVIVILVVGGGLFFFLGNKDIKNENEINQPTSLPLTTEQSQVDDKTIVDCGLAKDPTCFMNRMNGCLPATVKMMSSDNATTIEMTILGVEDEKCHFQRKINNVMDLNCFFPKGTMNWDTIDQTFGNEKGLQKVVDDACKKGW